MRLLITGGAGFIGSHIAEQAVALGWTVAVVDDLSGGRRENVPAAARFFQCDIRNPVGLQQVFADFRPEVVSHQAAQAQSPYACSKFAVEKYLESFRREHGLNSTVLRYANVYGPRQDPHGEAGVVAIFCKRMLAAEPVSVFARRTAGDPGCVRDYVYIADVVKANLAAMQGLVPDSILNVGTGIETNTLQLAEQLKQILQSPSEIRFGDIRPGDVERSLLDADRFQQLLGTTVNVPDGLQQTARWFREHRST